MFQSALLENINLMKVILKLVPVRGALINGAADNFLPCQGRGTRQP